MAEDLSVRFVVDTRDITSAFEQLRAEAGKSADKIEEEFKKVSADVYEIKYEVNVDTGELELVGRQTSALEKQRQKAEQDALKDIQRRAKEEERVAKQKERDRRAEEREITALRKQRERITKELEKQAAAAAAAARIQKGSLTDLNRRLQAEQAILNDMVRGTEEYRKQAALVKQIQGQRQVQMIGTEGVKAAAFGELATAFSKTAFIAQQVFDIVGALGGQLDALVSRAAKLEALEFSFKAIGAGASGAQIALQESDRIALGLGVSIDTVREGFQKLSPVILASGGTLGDVSSVTEALSSRFAAFGKTGEESRRIMNGIIQAFGKGKLQAEELTQQIGEADPAFKIDLANAIGVSVAALEKMVKNGEITSQRLMTLIPLLGKSGQMFGKMGTSASSAVAALAKGEVPLNLVRTQLENLSKVNIETLANIFSPLILAAFQVQAALTDLTTQILNSQAFQFLANVINATGQVIAVMIQGLAGLAQAFILATEPVFALINGIDNISQKFLGFEAVSLVLGAALAGLAVKFALVAASAAKAAAAGLVSLFQAAIPAVTALTASLVGPTGGMLALSGATATATTSTVAYGVASTSAAGGVTALTIASAPLLATLAVLAPAAIAVGAAVNTWQTVVGPGNEILKETDEIVNKLNEDMAELGAQTMDTSTIQERAEERVGGFQAGLDKLRGAIRLQTAAEAQLIDESNKLVEANDRLMGATDKHVASLEEQIAASDGSEESQKKIADQANVLTQALSSQQAKIQQQINALKAVTNAGGKLSDAEQQKLMILQYVNDALQGQIDKIENLVPGLQKGSKASQEFTAAQEELVTALKEAKDAKEALIEPQIEAIKEEADARTESLKQQKEAAKEVSDGIVQGIQDEKRASKEASDARIEQINEQKRQIAEVREQQKAAFDSIKTQSKENHDERISQLNAEIAKIEANGAAELAQLDAIANARKLESDQRVSDLERQKQAVGEALNSELEARKQAKTLKELQAKAQSAETAEEKKAAQEKIREIQEEDRLKKAAKAEEARLQAQIDAERKAQAQREIAEAQAKAEAEKKIAEEVAAKKKEIEAAEKAHAEEMKALKEAEAKLEQENKAKLKELDDAARAEKKAENENQKKFDEEIRAEKKAAKEEEKQFEEEIADIKKKAEEDIKKLKDEVKQLEKEIEQASRLTAENMGKQATEAERLAKALEKAAAAQERIQRAGGGGGAPRFAGGPVTGGKTYTVNELGREAFLSRSGVLKAINAPSFGQWRAPSAGTVIPAHIAAGLDIPKGGINVNTAGLKMNDAAQGLGAISRSALGGNVSRITNNVTIQSQAPVSDASRMLVEMSKLRLRKR